MATKPMSPLGEHIYTLRMLLGLSLRDVADKSGLTKAHIWELEDGRATNPTVKTLLMLATALNTKAEKLAALALSGLRNQYAAELTRRKRGRDGADSTN